MKTLSKTQKAKLCIDIINDLKQLDNKSIFYVMDNDDDIIVKIAKRCGIKTSMYSGEAGMIDISEYIRITYDNREDHILHILHDRKRYCGISKEIDFADMFKVSDSLVKITKDFESNNVPDSGMAKTEIGEIFRAIRYIQYRAYNDGDIYYEIGSPTFMSYMFIISKIDELNHSSSFYNSKSGQYSCDFTDTYLKDLSCDGIISDVIESKFAGDALYIKYQLMDLLSNNMLVDRLNNVDSRSYEVISEYEY